MVQATIQAVNLPGLRDAQMLVKHYRQGVSVRVFPEKISIWISRQRREDAFTSENGY